MYIKTEVAASAERKDASTTNTSPKRVLKLKRPSSEVDMIGETVGWVLHLESQAAFHMQGWL